MNKNLRFIFATLMIWMACFFPWKSFSQGMSQSSDSITQTNPPSQSFSMSELQAWKVPLRPAEEMHSVSNLETLMKFFTTTYTKDRTSEQKSEHTIILF